MAETQELTVQQKITALNKKGTETLEALLTTKTLTAAAAMLEIDRVTLYKRIDEYQLNELVAQIKQQAVLTLAQSSVDAAENLAKKIDSSDDKASILASTEILDRAGIVKPQTSEGGTNINFWNVAKKDIDEFTAPKPV